MKTKIKEAEKILKALANARRLAIVKYLRKEKEATVGDIAEAIKLSFKATSKHLDLVLRVYAARRFFLVDRVRKQHLGEVFFL